MGPARKDTINRQDLKHEFRFEKIDFFPVCADRHDREAKGKHCILNRALYCQRLRRVQLRLLSPMFRWNQTDLWVGFRGRQADVR